MIPRALLGVVLCVALPFLWRWVAFKLPATVRGEIVFSIFGFATILAMAWFCYPLWTPLFHWLDVVRP